MVWPGRFFMGDQHFDGSYDRLSAPLFTPTVDNLKRVVDDRLPGPNGEAGKGMTLKEAMHHARNWWAEFGPHLAHASRGQAEFGGLPSGIARGLDWELLDRAEILVIIDKWYDEVGLPRMIRDDKEPDKWILDPLAHAGGSTVKAK